MILTRRDVLQQTAWLMAAAAIPAVPARAAEQAASETAVSITSIMAELSTYMSEAGNRSLPDDVVEKTKQHILDTLAAMISGVDLPPAQVALKFARAYGGEKTATIVGSNMACGPLEAALVNGMLAHSDETDDSHAPFAITSGLWDRLCCVGCRRAIRHQRYALPARCNARLRYRSSCCDDFGWVAVSNGDSPEHP